MTEIEQLRKDKNDLTIRAYRAEDERDEYRRLYNETAAQLNDANARISAARDALGYPNTASAPLPDGQE